MSMLLFILYILAAWNSSLVYLTLPAIFLLVLIVNRGKLNYSPSIMGGVVVFVLLLVLFEVCSMFFGVGLSEAIRGGGRYFCYLLALLSARGIRRDQAIWLFRLIGLMLLVALPFYRMFLFDEVVAGLFRYTFIFEHPNHFGYALIPIFSYFLLYEENRRYRAIGLVATTLSIALCLSSGAILCMALILAAHYVTRLRTFFIGLAVIALLGGIAYEAGALDKFTTQADSAFSVDIQARAEDENFGGAGSLSWRLIYWSAILSSFISENWRALLIGRGFGSMSFGSYVYPFMYTDPHNDLIRVLVENGIVGLLFFGYIGLNVSRIQSKHRYSFIAMIAVPFLFGNTLVNPSYIWTFILLYMVVDQRSANFGEMDVKEVVAYK